MSWGWLHVVGAIYRYIVVLCEWKYSNCCMQPANSCNVPRLYIVQWLTQFRICVLRTSTSRVHWTCDTILWPVLFGNAGPPSNNFNQLYERRVENNISGRILYLKLPWFSSVPPFKLGHECFILDPSQFFIFLSILPSSALFSELLTESSNWPTISKINGNVVSGVQITAGNAKASHWTQFIATLFHLLSSHLVSMATC